MEMHDQNMYSQKLTPNERFIILTIRSFNFLETKGYRISKVDCYQRDPGVEYINNEVHVRINLAWEEGCWYFSLESGLWFPKKFNSNDLLRAFKIPMLNYFINDFDMEKIISFNAEFVQSNLMSAIEGRGWPYILKS